MFAQAVTEWRILDMGDLPEECHEIDYTCLNCLTESKLPVVGLVIAQSHSSLVFDPGPRQLPKRIRCPVCRSTLELS